MRRCRYGMVMVVLIAVVAGCGGDDGGGDEPLTKQEWVAAVDSICLEILREEASIPEPQSTEDLVETFDAYADMVRDKLAAMRALAAPQGEEAATEEILTSFDTLIDTGEEWVLAVAVDEDSEETTGLFIEMEEATQAARELAGEYGLENCFVDPEG